MDVDLNSEIKNGEDAIRALNGLRKAFQEQGSKLAERDAAVADLKAAVNTLRQETAEANARAATADAQAKGFEPFITKDASGKPRIRFNSEEDPNLGFVKGLFDADAPANDWHRKTMELVEQHSFASAFTVNKADPHARSKAPKALARLKQHLATGPMGIGKIFTDSTGVGAEWVPDPHVPLLVETMTAQRKLEAVFDTYTMNAKNQVLPVLSTGLRPYIKGQPTDDTPGQYTPSTPVTDSRTKSAIGFAVRTLIDEDADEDSVIAAEPIIRRLLASAFVDGTEDCIVNGDTTATHQDTITDWNIRGRWGSTGLGGSADHRRAWIGLRARAADVSATVDGNAAQTYAGYLTTRGLLDSPMGLGPDNLMVVSPEYYLAKMLGWSEFSTLEKYGAGAAVLTGEIGRVGNAPVIISEFMAGGSTYGMNASGIYDNSTKTKTAYVILNRTRFLMGIRRSMMIELDKDITRGVIHAVATVRKLFFTIDSTTAKNVAYAYNLG
jgi:hypothetical protein